MRDCRMTARGYKVSSRDSENALELDRDDDCVALSRYEMPPNCSLEHG